MGLEWEQVVVATSSPVELGRWWCEALEWVVVDDDPPVFEIRPQPDRLPGILFLFPPQPMVTEIRTVLQQYAAKGGRVQTEMFDGSGHGPLIDAPERWRELFFSFIGS